LDEWINDAEEEEEEPPPKKATRVMPDRKGRGKAVYNESDGDNPKKGKKPIAKAPVEVESDVEESNDEPPPKKGKAKAVKKPTAAGRPITFTLMAHLRSRRCEIVEARKCTRVGCSEVAVLSSSVMDKFDFPCSKCSEDFYVENYGRLTQTEWGFLAPQVQEYNKTLLAQYGVDPSDFLIPIEMRLSD
jgi:hypothetical protein